MVDIVKRLRALRKINGWHEDEFLTEAADEIERLRSQSITPDMIAAGVYVAREHQLGQSLEDLVVSVYSIMRAAETRTAPSQSPRQSRTSRPPT